MESRKDATVIAWLDRHDPEEYYTTAVNLFEIVLGIEKLDRGHKRAALAAALGRLLSEMLKDHVLPFDDDAAIAAGSLHGARRRAGKPVGNADTQIAGIVISRNATFATRNVKHFADLSIPAVDPWEA